MNISKFNALLSISTVLIAGLAVAIPTVHAGPGPAYWSNLGRPQATFATVSVPTTDAAHGAACADMQTSAKMEILPGLPNGRSTIRAVQTGTTLTCSACAKTEVVQHASWSNARGPLAPASTKGTHDCRTGCMMAATE